MYVHTEPYGKNSSSTEKKSIFLKKYFTIFVLKTIKYIPNNLSGRTYLYHPTQAGA